MRAQNQAEVFFIDCNVSTSCSGSCGRALIDPALRSLVTMRVSQVNSCSFCFDIYSATLLKRGLAMENVQALEYRQMSELSDEHERLALDYARAMTDGKQQGDDDRFQIQNLFLEEDALVKLTGLIAFQDLSSKFNSALAMPAQEFCRLPKNVLSRAGGLDGKATKK